MKIKNILPMTKCEGIYFKNCFCSYATIQEKSIFVAQRITEELTTNECIGIFLDNSTDYIISYFAIAHMDNRIIVPFYSKIAAGEIVKEIRLCGINCLITNRDKVSWLKKAFASSKIALYAYLVDEDRMVTISIGIVESSSHIIDSVPDAIILLQTSGSSLYPKKVIHTNYSIITNAKLHNQGLGIDSKEKVSIHLPMCFSYCNTAQILSSIIQNNSIYIDESAFNPSEFIAFCNKYSITSTNLVPSQIAMICNTIEEIGDVSSLRKVMCTPCQGHF